MSFTDIFPSLRTKTFAAIADVDAIKTAIATAAAPATYSGVALNGAIGAAALGVSQTFTVKTRANAGAYVTANPIVVTGLDWQGKIISESVSLTQTNGGETVQGTKAFARFTSIAVPAQNDTSGSFEFGVGDILLDMPARELRAGAIGDIKVGYQDGGTDVLPSIAAERHTVLAFRVYSTGTTALPVTVYL